MTAADGWDNEKLRTNIVECWQGMKVGVGIYARMPSGREPVFLAGAGRDLTVNDINSAINFLTALKRHLPADD